MTAERSGRDAGERIRVGTSGWSYPSWRPGFYPAGTPPEGFLAHDGARVAFGVLAVGGSDGRDAWETRAS